MTSNSSGKNGSNIKQTFNWSPRRWFVIFGGTLFVWTLVYLFSHSHPGYRGYEYTRFTAADIRHINSILVNNAPAIQQTGGASKQRINNTNDGFLDTYDDSSGAPYTASYPEVPAYMVMSEADDRKERVKKVMVYISSQYANEIDADATANIQQYVSTFTPRETGVFLADYRLKVASFFWLTGAMVYAEVVFWVIFGVLCSLLFFTGNVIRKGNGNGYAHRDIIYQSARIFYAPFSAIILILAYSYMRGDSTLHIEIGEGIIVFSFLFGYYSGVVMELLDKMRGNSNGVGNKQVERQPAYAAPTQQPVAQYNPESDIRQQPVRKKADDDEAIIVEDEQEEQYHPEQSLKERKKVMNEDNEINEVDIDLKLDFSGLFEEERIQLQRLGFAKAIVTLHNVNGKDIIPAKKFNEDMTTFVASDVKPGIYIARATLSQRLKDDQIINLFGEKTAYITEDKPGLELYVKKYEAMG